MTSETSFVRDGQFPLADVASAYGGTQRRKTLGALESGASSSAGYSTGLGARAYASNDNDEGGSESSGEEGSFFAQAARDPPLDVAEFVGGGGIMEKTDDDDDESGEQDDDAAAVADSEGAIAQIGEAFGAILGAGAWDGSDSDDDDEEDGDGDDTAYAKIRGKYRVLPAEANYQYRKDAHGRYTLVNSDTGQVFMLAHESSPLVAFLTTLAFHENIARGRLGSKGGIPATNRVERVPGVLGFFVQCVLRDGVRSLRTPEFRAADNSLMTVEPYKVDVAVARAQCEHAFVCSDTTSPIDELCSRAASTSPEHRRLVQRAFEGDCSLAEIVCAEDPSSDGHLQRFELRGQTCDLTDDDSGFQSNGFSSISPVEDDDSGQSAWFVVAPAYVAMYEAHRSMLCASGSLAAKVTARRVETVDKVFERLGQTKLSRGDVASVLAALGEVLGGEETDEARAREKSRLAAIEHLAKLSEHSARVRDLASRCSATPNEVSTLGSFMAKLGGSALVNGVRSELLADELTHVSDTLAACGNFTDSLTVQD